MDVALERMRLQRSWHPVLNDVEETHDDGSEWEQWIAGWTYDLGWIAAGTWWIGLDQSNGEVFLDWECERHRAPGKTSVSSQLADLEVLLLNKIKEMIP